MPFKQWTFQPSEGKGISKLIIGAAAIAAAAEPPESRERRRQRIRNSVKKINEAACDKVDSTSRQLYAENHPDAGGSASDFIRLTKAGKARKAECQRKAKQAKAKIREKGLSTNMREPKRNGESKEAIAAAAAGVVGTLLGLNISKCKNNGSAKCCKKEEEEQEEEQEEEEK